MSQPIKKNDGPVQLGGVIQDILKTCRPESSWQLSRVCEQWRDLVGSKAAENTMPEAFKENVLLVHATSPVWIHHMQFSKTELVEKVNVAFGEKIIDTIIFQIGRVRLDAAGRPPGVP